ncbi:hypothetical protein QBC44DRAFT_386294 [Cladorrhinum sp. PSN332]|nr:hypothetical protein QBC44DRAFT_386294 [Cladorrhinum sp. PSN332]
MRLSDDSGFEDMESSLHPFLDNDGARRALRHIPNSGNAHKSLLFAAGICMLALTAWLAVLSSQVSQCSCNDAAYSPAGHVLRYRDVVFDSGFGLERTNYQGPPTPERDALWEDLYNFGVSQVPGESAAKLVNKTVPIPDLLPDRYYAVELDIFHQLHCLNMIRKRLYREYYPPDEEMMGMEHIEHCYDSLRQSLMCSVDVTPLPWQWVEKDQQAKVVGRVLHTCRDFEAVKKWAVERKVAKFDRYVHVPDDLS